MVKKAYYLPFLVLSLLLLMLPACGGGNGKPTPAVTTATTETPAVASEIELFNNGNVGGVDNNPTNPTTFTLTDTYNITSISDYHWNHGQGANPGAIGLTDNNGKAIGTWHAIATSGQGGAPNVNWDIKPNIVIGPGTYTVVDSDSATWSQNSQSNNKGFTLIKGMAATSAVSSKTETPTITTTPTNIPTTVSTETPVTAPEVNIIASKTQEIDASGGTINVADDVSVVVPAGAVDSATEMTINKIDPASYFESSGDVERVVVDCTSPVTQFKNNVEIRVLLPNGMTEDDSSSVLAGLIDEPTGAVIVQPSNIRMIDNKPVLVIATNHFTPFAVEYPTAAIRYAEMDAAQKAALLPPAYPPLVIPYYSQGTTLYCWAACLQMVTQAVSYHADRTVFDIMGAMKVGESGLNIFYASDLLTPKLTDVIKERTGVEKPERTIFGKDTPEEFKYYIKREISNQHPVALFSSAMQDPNSVHPGHAIVIVGYDGDTLYYHNPQGGKTDNHIGYSTRTFQDFINELTTIHFWIITLTIPTKELDPDRPQVTVNIGDQALTFQKAIVEQAGGEKSEGIPIANFRWDYTMSKGYSFREAKSGERVGGEAYGGSVYEFLPDSFASVDILPDSVKQLKLREPPGDYVEIVNSSLDAEKTITVQMVITSLGSGQTYYFAQKQLTVPPNSRGGFTLTDLNLNDPSKVSKEIEIDKFRDNNVLPTEYRLTITALDSGKVDDSASISFKINGEFPTISSERIEGAVGSKVIINGSGFGTVQGFATEKTFEYTTKSGEVSTRYLGVPSQVTFNNIPATEITSWSDDQIVVKVPPGATTGDVVITRGNIKSNPVTFTVTETKEMTGDRKLSWDFDSPVGTGKHIYANASVNWEVISTGASLFGNSDQGDIYIHVQPNTPIHLAVTGQGTLDTMTEKLEEDYGSYALATYHLTLDASAPVSNGEVLGKSTRSAGSVTWDFTLPWSETSVVAGFWVSCDVEYYDKDNVLKDNGQTAPNPSGSSFTIYFTLN